MTDSAIHSPAERVLPFGDPRISYKLTSIEAEDYELTMWEDSSDPDEGRFYDDEAYLFVDNQLTYTHQYRVWADWSSGPEVTEKIVYDAWIQSLNSNASRLT